MIGTESWSMTVSCSVSRVEVRSGPMGGDRRSCLQGRFEREEAPVAGVLRRMSQKDSDPDRGRQVRPQQPTRRNTGVFRTDTIGPGSPAGQQGALRTVLGLWEAKPLTAGVPVMSPNGR